MDFNFRHLSLLLIAGVSGFGILAQGTQSPYSNFGLGQINDRDFIQHGSAGYTSTSYYSRNSFSGQNAASLGALQYASFQFGANADQGRFSTSTAQRDVLNGNMGYVGLGARIMERKYRHRRDSVRRSPGADEVFRWGSAVTLQPRTAIGYGFKISGTDSGGANFLTEYRGSGGLAGISFMNGFQLNRFVSVGINNTYVFGQLGNYSFVENPDTTESLGVEDRRIEYVRGFSNGIGLQLKHYNKNKDRTHRLEHTFGFTTQFGSTLRGEKSRLVTRQRYDRFTQKWYVQDTVLNAALDQGNEKLPSSISMGYALNYRQKFRFSVEYRKENWSQYSSDFNTRKLNDRESFSAGLVLNPDAMPRKRAAKKERVPLEWRFGYRYVKTQNYFHSASAHTDILENAVSFGAGIPLRLKSYNETMPIISYLNIGLEYLNRGTLNNGLVQEKYLRVFIGMNLSDIWFTKSRID